MIINSLMSNLLEHITKKLSDNNINSFEFRQIRFDNFLINTSFIIRSCLVLSDDGTVIDGFDTSPICYSPYKGKSFFELLGGKIYTQDMSIMATPIDKKLYIDNKYVEPDFTFYSVMN